MQVQIAISSLFDDSVGLASVTGRMDQGAYAAGSPCGRVVVSPGVASVRFRLTVHIPGGAGAMKLSPHGLIA